jgi:TRAP-type C4-dicarboxylate transport system substrate-binding protein
MGITLIATEMARILEERTDGRIKFEIYWSESLAKGTEMVNAVQTNIANMAYLRTFAEPGKMPLSTVGELPGLYTNDWVGNSAYTDLIHQEPILSEMKKYNMKPLYTFGILQQQLMCNKPIRSLDEAKGVKIAASGVAAKVWDQMGATVLSMSPVEQYEALSRGTIDAISVPKDAIKTFKFYEAGKYFVDIYTVPRLHPVVFNQGFWDSLPPDIQKIITDSIPDLVTSAYDAQNIQTAGVAWQEIQASGAEIIKWSDADVARVNAVLNEYSNTWASDMDAKGLPGTQLLNDYKAAVAKYEPLNPFK